MFPPLPNSAPPTVAAFPTAAEASRGAWKPQYRIAPPPGYKLDRAKWAAANNKFKAAYGDDPEAARRDLQQTSKHVVRTVKKYNPHVNDFAGVDTAAASGWADARPEKKKRASKKKKASGSKKRKMPERYKSGPKKGQFKPKRK